METIVEIIRDKIFWIMLYALTMTLINIIIVATHKNRRRKYIEWKKDTINLYFFKREWERNDDWALNELFSENERLDTEIKLLKKDKKDLSISVIGMLFILYIIGKFDGNKGKPN